MHDVMHKGGDKVLSYGDVLLRRSDVNLLKGPHWLNDQVQLQDCSTIAKSPGKAFICNRNDTSTCACADHYLLL